MLVPFENQLSSQIASDQPIRLFVVGSTGSIGCSTLQIARDFPTRFRVVGLSAEKNAQQIILQAREFNPEFVGLCDQGSGAILKTELASKSFRIGTSSDDLIEELLKGDYDILVAAASGFAGLSSVMAALKAGKQVALANKESLVAGGKLVSELIHRYKGSILPIDSEHSAIFQAIQGSKVQEIETLTLTASGGPFLDTPGLDLRNVTPEQAIRHPKWSMGRKISVDSATMFNKGLEVIEAHWLFGLKSERIEVVVHPQSILHSLVNFCDGSSLAQLSVPDMKGAISFAINYPNNRLAGVVARLRLTDVSPLEFFKLDEDRFRGVALARNAIEIGRGAPAVYNAANEKSVELFLEGKLRFDHISDQVESALLRFSGVDYSSVEELITINEMVRDYVTSEVGKGS